MQTLTQTSREAVYNAPILPYYTETYTPISNKQIMDLIEGMVDSLGLRIKGEDYKTTVSKEGLIKGVIGKYYVSTTNDDFGHQIMFRNSYDKSMSFAFCEGLVCWICENGCVSGDFTYKRVHKGVYDDGISSTWYDVFDNVNTGFKHLQESFETTVNQMEELKKFKIGENYTYQILGDLFINKEVMNVSQISIAKRELKMSRNFKHLGDKDYSAYDLYNHVTHSLKTCGPRDYIKSHTTLHKLFEETFGV